MPRYFFNICDGTDLIDREGTELLDDEQAKSDAVNLAGRSIADVGDAFWQNGEQWSLEVTDDKRAVLFTLGLRSLGHAAFRPDRERSADRYHDGRVGRAGGDVTQRSASSSLWLRARDDGGTCIRPSPAGLSM
jgi:hypothetical protein